MKSTINARHQRSGKASCRPQPLRQWLLPIVKRHFKKKVPILRECPCSVGYKFVEATNTGLPAPDHQSFSTDATAHFYRWCTATASPSYARMQAARRQGVARMVKRQHGHTYSRESEARRHARNTAPLSRHWPETTRASPRDQSIQPTLKDDNAGEQSRSPRSCSAARGHGV